MYLGLFFPPPPPLPMEKWEIAPAESHKSICGCEPEWVILARLATLMCLLFGTIYHYFSRLLPRGFSIPREALCGLGGGHPPTQPSKQTAKCAMVKMVNSLFPPHRKDTFSPEAQDELTRVRRLFTWTHTRTLVCTPHTKAHTEEIYWTDISFFSVLLYFLTNNPYFLTRTRLIGPSASSNPVNLPPFISSSPRRTNDRYTKHHTHVLPFALGMDGTESPSPSNPTSAKK